MKAPSTLLKAVALTLVAFFTVVFAPLFSNHSVPEDPIALPDPRVEISLSQADLTEVLQLVRGSRYSSLYQRYWVQTDLPLRSIRASKPSQLFGPDQKATVVLPPGSIQATFSTGGHPELQEGMTYYFSKGRSGWHITKISRWVA